jgi:NADPH2:quinone reductase
VICRELGHPEALVLAEISRLPLGEGQVRVRLEACGVNFPDILQVQGLYQFKPELPFTPGVEAAGRVVEVAAGVTGVAVGDPVITRHRTGGYAEEVVVRAEMALPLPRGFSFAEGAAFLVGYQTAYYALVQRGRIRPGEVLLVHGAAGGVGMGAVEIGKLLGATVIATASSAAKLAVVAARGADHLINYREHPFVDEVNRLTGGKGADVIYDPVGGDVFSQSLRCIAWDGRLLIIGFTSGTIASAPANRVLLKGAAVIGVRAGEFGRRDPVGARHNREALLELAATGRLRPHIHAILPLERFADGMRLLSAREAIGRVVLATGPDAEVRPH